MATYLRTYGKPSASNGSQFHSVTDHGTWAPKRMPKRDAVEVRDSIRYAERLPIDQRVTRAHDPNVYDATLTRTERRKLRARRHNLAMAYRDDRNSTY